MRAATPPSWPPLDALRRGWAPLAVRWRELSARDRRLALLAAAVLALFLLWTLALRPALRTLATAPAQIEAAELELQAMQRLAAEAARLRSIPPMPAAQAALALKVASDRLGDGAKLSVQGDRAVLTFTRLGSDALRNWLTEVRAGARARPIEARITREAQGHSGTVTLVLGGAP